MGFRFNLLIKQAKRLSYVLALLNCVCRPHKPLAESHKTFRAPTGALMFLHGNQQCRVLTLMTHGCSEWSTARTASALIFQLCRFNVEEHKIFSMAFFAGRRTHPPPADKRVQVYLADTVFVERRR